MKTDYKLASTQLHYGQANRFLRGNNVDYTGLSFPTIIAYKKGKVIGVLGTHPQTDIIMAGPLFVDNPDGSNAFATLRLIEAYENVMRHAKVSAYYFTSRVDQEKWNRQIVETGYKEVNRTHTHILYRKDL